MTSHSFWEQSKFNWDFPLWYPPKNLNFRGSEISRPYTLSLGMEWNFIDVRWPPSSPKDSLEKDSLLKNKSQPKVSFSFILMTIFWMVLPPWWKDRTWDIVPNTKDGWWNSSLWHEVFHGKGCSKTWVLHPHFEGNGFLLWLFQTKDFWKSKTKRITTKVMKHNNWDNKGCRCCENIGMVGRNHCSNNQEDGSLWNQRHNLDDGINFLTKDWVNKHTQNDRNNHDTQGT